MGVKKGLVVGQEGATFFPDPEKSDSLCPC